MTDPKITELNDAPDLADLTDEEIKSWPTAKLREAAKIHLSDYSLRETIASLPLDELIIAAPKGLTATEVYIQLILKTYAHRDAVVTRRYGTVDVQAWYDDEQLQNSIRYARDQARKARGDS